MWRYLTERYSYHPLNAVPVVPLLVLVRCLMNLMDLMNHCVIMDFEVRHCDALHQSLKTLRPNQEHSHRLMTKSHSLARHCAVSYQEGLLIIEAGQ